MAGRILTGAALLGAVIGGQASALSCAPPDIVRSYEYASGQDEMYFLLKGQVSLTDGQEMPQASDRTGDPDEMLLDPVYGAFTGEIYQLGGFEVFDAPIEVRLRCLSAWCGDYPGDEPALYIAEVSDTNMWLSIEMPPCGGTVFDISALDELMDHLERADGIGAE